MLNKKKVLSEHKIVLSNTIFLFVLKASDYLLPMILLPYLVMVLGIEYFGLLAFATATVGFARGIITYGFDLTGTQQISINRNNIDELKKIFSSIIFVKLLLAVLTFFILILIVLFVPKFHSNMNIYVFTFLIVFGDIFFPVWFFQGIENMKFITYLRIIYKLFFIVIIFIFIKEKSDYWLVPILDAVSSLMIGLVSMYIIYKKYNIYLALPKVLDIRYQLYHGWHVFLSQFAVVMYTTINTFLLGIMTSNEIVGIYSLAYKIYLALRGLLSPVTQALFPYLSNEYVKDKLNFYSKVRNISIGYFIILLSISMITFLFADLLIKLISNEIIPEAIVVLEILAFALPFSIGSFYSSLLVIQSKKKQLSQITLLIMILNTILVFPIIYYFGIYGLAILFTILQVLQAFLQIRYNLEIWHR